MLIAVAVGVQGVVASVSKMESNFDSFAADVELVIREEDVRTSHLEVRRHSIDRDVFGLLLVRLNFLLYGFNDHRSQFLDELVDSGLHRAHQLGKM